MFSEESRQRLAKEYRYAATKMQESQQPAKKLFYFSVLFGEAQRILNREWDRDLAMIYMAANFVYTQITAQTSLFGVLPIDGPTLYTQLTQATSDLATYLEKTEDKDNTKELHQIMGRLAEIGYAVTGNGSYLYEKGLIKF